jgi:hypothetical protein
MIAGLPNVRPVECGWQSWPKFRTTVRHMHLLLQRSDTEFVPDGDRRCIAERVPSIVSEAIDWVPDHWKAPIDWKLPSTVYTRWPAWPATCSPLPTPRKSKLRAR